MREVDVVRLFNKGDRARVEAMGIYNISGNVCKKGKMMIKIKMENQSKIGRAKFSINSVLAIILCFPDFCFSPGYTTRPCFSV